MPRALRILIPAMVAVFLFSGTALFVLRDRLTARGGSLPASTSTSDPRLPDDSVADLAIPPFTLTTQAGAQITRDYFKGRVTVVDFFFTHCPFICPALTQKMRDLTRRVDDPGVQFLSISVDPAHDTPEVLRGYAERNQADLKRWTFATGDKATIDSIVKIGLKFALYDDAKAPVTLPDGSTMSNVVHPPFFVLVNDQGAVLGLYPAVAMPEAVDALVERLDRVVQRRP